MADTRNRNKYNNRRVGNRMAYYEDGNAVRRLEEVPSRPKKRLSSTVQKNRAKSTNMGKGYMIFLAIMCALTTGACVHFLKLTAEVTEQKSTVAAKEIELNELKTDNDAYYSDIMTGVDLDEIRDKAINELGMEYASEEQIKYYKSGNNNYVRQYQDVPN